MAHRKWKEIKQQPGTAGPGNILGCCLVSLRFLCDINSIHSVPPEPILTDVTHPDDADPLLLRILRTGVGRLRAQSPRNTRGKSLRKSCSGGFFPGF